MRRNKLSDFAQVNRAGKIAMRLDEGEQIVDVQICTEENDVLLTTANGQCIRFPVTDVRVFKGRDSMGVRGIALGEGDHVISLAILRHSEAESAERIAYLKMRRAVAGELAPEGAGDTLVENAGDDTGAPDSSPSTVQDAQEPLPEGAQAGTLSPERYADMSAREEIILTISANGYGKRTSSYEYRITGRGGKGIVAMAVNPRNGPLVASMPVEDSDGIMLVTNGGQLIRCPVEGIRIAGRGTQGVIVFDTAERERVVSVERISEEEAAAEEGHGDAGNGDTGNGDAGNGDAGPGDAGDGDAGPEAGGEG